MTKIYTRSGDRGTTSVIGGDRIPKDYPCIEIIGTLDELNSWIGLVRTHLSHSAESFTILDDELNDVQQDLFELGAVLAGSDGQDFSTAKTDRLETRIDAKSAELDQLTNFILPGGSESASLLYVCRSVCRRAERRYASIHDSEKFLDDNYASEEGRQVLDHAVSAYLNRLSDYLFVSARWVNLKLEVTEEPWTR